MEKEDLVLCTVEKVTPTVTFVRLPDGTEGTIISSEIAPGRIKFMRQYVVPNKKIVCKILDISRNHVHLSLRRVTAKEKKEVMERFQQERAISTALKQILEEGEEEVKKRILKDFENFSEFLKEIKGNEKLIEKYVPKNKVDAIKKVIDKRKKKHEMVQLVKMKCLEDDGLRRIKEIFDLKENGVSATYISAGEFKLKLVVDDFKEGKKKMAEIIENLEKKSKENSCEFSAHEVK